MQEFNTKQVNQRKVSRQASQPESKGANQPTMYNRVPCYQSDLF